MYDDKKHTLQGASQVSICARVSSLVVMCGFMFSVLSVLCCWTTVSSSFVQCTFKSIHYHTDLTVCQRVGRMPSLVSPKHPLQPPCCESDFTIFTHAMLEMLAISWHPLHVTQHVLIRNLLLSALYTFGATPDMYKSLTAPVFPCKAAGQDQELLLGLLNKRLAFYALLGSALIS